MNKLDALISAISNVKLQPANGEAHQNKVERFILEKEKNGELTKQNSNKLSIRQGELKKDVVHHSLLIDRHENFIC